VVSVSLTNYAMRIKDEPVAAPTSATETKKAAARSA